MKAQESKDTMQESSTFFTISLDADKHLQGKEHNNEALMDTFNDIALAVCDARSSISTLDALLDDISQDQKHKPGGIITDSRINKIDFFHCANVTRMCNDHLHAIEDCLHNCKTVYDSLILAEGAKQRASQDNGTVIPIKPVVDAPKCHTEAEQEEDYSYIPEHDREEMLTGWAGNNLSPNKKQVIEHYLNNTFDLLNMAREAARSREEGGFETILTKALAEMQKGYNILDFLKAEDL